MNWQERKVLITGGASFIGSHLVDAVVKRGAMVRVIDAVRTVFKFTKHRAKIKFLPNMPTGPLNLVADNTLAKDC